MVLFSKESTTVSAGIELGLTGEMGVGVVCDGIATGGRRDRLYISFLTARRDTFLITARPQRFLPVYGPNVR